MSGSTKYNKRSFFVHASRRHKRETAAVTHPASHPYLDSQQQSSGGGRLNAGCYGRNPIVPHNHRDVTCFCGRRTFTFTEPPIDVLARSYGQSAVGAVITEDEIPVERCRCKGSFQESDTQHSTLQSTLLYALVYGGMGRFETMKSYNAANPISRPKQGQEYTSRLKWRSPCAPDMLGRGAAHQTT